MQVLEEPAKAAGSLLHEFRAFASAGRWSTWRSAWWRGRRSAG